METIKFREEDFVRAALKFDQPDFSIEFNQQQRTWKWSGDRGTAKLQNSVAEYHVANQINLACEKESYAWINDGWLIPYPIENSDLLKVWSRW